MRSFFLPSLLALVASTTALTPRVATACGGTFCDRPTPTPAQPNPPPAMPVDQTGENILFVMDSNQVEAHVQIQYTGDPERFAWIVPVQSEPTSITPGSQPLFVNMSNATVPRLQQSTSVQFDVCSSGAGAGSSLGCASEDAAGFSSGDAAGGFFGPSDPPTARPDPGLEVKQKIVGAYEVATLKGGTVQEILVWLDENSYQIPPSTGELLGSYLERKYVFVALKLVAGAGLDEIHPIVFSYPGDQPCIPLKLTAVAAKEDMAIRAFFLATDRYVPKNYRHVLLNDARFDWLAPFLSQGTSPSPNPSATPSSTGAPIDLSNYKQAVSRAVDSPVADGRAFVTEFAGASSRVNRNGITSSSWGSSALAKATPQSVPSVLMSQQILSCPPNGVCTSPYPLVTLLLHKYLPVPSGMSEAAYYNCSSCIAQQTKGKPFDAEAFAAEYEALVLVPSRHAVDVLGKGPFLTRLFTTISPGEMTEDPEFRRLPGSPIVDNTSLTTQRRQTCDGRQTRVLPSGREVLVTDPASQQSNVWPTFGDDMPWVERIEDYSAPGPGVVLVDNRKNIDDSLARFHAARSWPPSTEFGLNPNSCSYRPAGRTLLARLLLGASLVGLLARRRRRATPPA